MSLNELIINQPKPWLPIRIWNCFIDNVFTLLPNAVSGRVLRSDAKGNGTWQDPATFTVSSIASDGSVSVNGVSPASATTGAVTLTATGQFGSRNINTSGNLTAQGNLNAGNGFANKHVLAGDVTIGDYLVLSASTTLFSNPTSIYSTSTLAPAGQLVSGVLIASGQVGPIILTTDTAVAIKAQLQNTGLVLTANLSFSFWLMNESVAATVALEGGTGVTVVQPASAIAGVAGGANDSQIYFVCVCTNAATPTFNIYC